MDNTIKTIMDMAEFPSDAKEFFIAFDDALDDDDRLFLDKTVGEYLENRAFKITPLLESYALQKSWNVYSLDMLFLLYAAARLQKTYKHGDELFLGILLDMKYKLLECRQVYGVWGTFVLFWYYGFFHSLRFTLGRFQFERAEFQADEYEAGGVKLLRGDTVYNMHIPSSGPITKDKRLDSYKRAFDFFGFKKGEKIPIVSHSWILYPTNTRVFDKNSNLYSFMHDFDIICSEEPENAFPNAWRIFNKDYNGDTSVLPKDTSLRRNICEWLDAGGKIGSGYGIIIFDGENIVKNRHL